MHNNSQITVLLFGQNGQLGFELSHVLKKPELSIRLIALGRDECDLSNNNEIISVFQKYYPDIVINAAAYTAVDRAESEPDLAYQINAIAPKIMAQQSSKINALLIHYSTDYVFDGDKQAPYHENDITSPLNIYGKSKRLGEIEIEKYSSKYIIFRTSWVIGSHGHNFIKTIFRLANEKESLNIVSDQTGVPTSTKLLSDIVLIIISMLKNDKSQIIDSGIYHLTPTGSTTWYNYARYALTAAKDLGFSFSLSLDNVLPIKSEDYPVSAKRPLNSLLDTNKICSVLGLVLPCWQEGVDEVVAEILAK